MLKIKSIKAVYESHLLEVRDCLSDDWDEDTEYIPDYTDVTLRINDDGIICLDITSPIPWYDTHTTTISWSSGRDMTIADLKKAHRIIGILSR